MNHTTFLVHNDKITGAHHDTIIKRIKTSGRETILGRDALSFL